MTATARFVTIPETLVAVGPRQMALVEYPYDCSCGESYREVAHALSCRKCRNYSVGGRCIYIEDTRTGELVWGRYPTQEEHDEYEAEAAEERVAWERRMAMFYQEGELYEQIVAEQAAAAALAARELAIDQLYMVQDQLMGY